MKVTDFTPADVQALVRQAEASPLQNMAHAEAVSKLLRRFAEWYPLTQELPASELSDAQKWDLIGPPV